MKWGKKPPQVAHRKMNVLFRKDTHFGTNGCPGMKIFANNMSPDFILAQARTNEQRMALTIQGVWGICAVCYSLAILTRHHVSPRSVSKGGRAFIALLCQPCHTVAHQIETNENLALKHQTLADMAAQIRTARKLP